MVSAPAEPAPAGSLDPWADVVGQDDARARLRASAATPVHAYLFIGPSGGGRRTAARAFAAELLRSGTAGEAADRHVRLALAEQHPDLTVVERSGASIAMGDPDHPEPGTIRWLVRRAGLRPVDAARSVYVVLEAHLLPPFAAAALLKTLEEPPAHVVFVVVADEVTPALVTVASRCVRIDFHRIAPDALTARLLAEGVPAESARAAAAAAGGSLDRARLLAADPRLGVREAAWAAVPGRLDGTGAAAVALAAELAAHLDDAQGPLEERHRAELADLDEHGRRTGARVARKEVEERHRREIRRLRTDGLRRGLDLLGGAYRDALVAHTVPAPDALAAVERLRRVTESLVRNPNEALQLQALLRGLPPLPPR